MNTQTENETVPTHEDGAEAKPAQQSVETQEADDEDEDEGDAGSNGEDTSEGQRPKRKRPRWSDLNRAHREALDAQAEARALRERLEQLQRGEPAQAAEAPKEEGKRPTLEDFDFDQERYLEALADWRIEERERAKVQKVEQEKAQQTVQERIAALQSKEAEFAKAHPDYEGVAKAPHVPITREMADTMLENPDTAPAIAYYLGQNLEEAREISQMSPLAQARAIGRIEAKLTTPQTTPPPPKPVPKTPAVPPTLQPGATSTRDWSQMDTAEHIRAFREKQSQARR